MMAQVSRIHNRGGARPSRPVACPHSGIFTDGGCSPNPGPGGWAVVVVEDDQIVEEFWGGDPASTNNRMELTGLIRALQYCRDTQDNRMDTIYSDSHLCVQTYNDWMERWAAQGWRRRTGPVENLDLVQELYQLKRQCPQVRVAWIPAHRGLRWNEYVDGLVARARSR
ncbi:ribonuclease H family protein [Synechococcus sp. H55.10]|uniref:ribonuclease H family protein n=2 Tax=unclassified Synechococcus TaxID=2626047 RepID=UPI0039C69F1C